MTTTPRFATALTATALLALTACGGGETSDEEAVDALVESFESNSEGPDLDDDQIRCVSTNIVDSLGAERSLDIDEDDLNGNLSGDEAESVTNAFVDCIDVDTFFRDVFEEDPAFAEIPESFVDCIIGEIGDEGLRSALVAQFTGDGDAEAMGEELGAEAGQTCISQLSPEELQDLAGG